MVYKQLRIRVIARLYIINFLNQKSISLSFNGGKNKEILNKNAGKTRYEPLLKTRSFLVFLEASAL